MKARVVRIHPLDRPHPQHRWLASVVDLPAYRRRRDTLAGIAAFAQVFVLPLLLWQAWFSLWLPEERDDAPAESRDSDVAGEDGAA